MYRETSWLLVIWLAPITSNHSNHFSWFWLIFNHFSKCLIWLENPKMKTIFQSNHYYLSCDFDEHYQQFRLKAFFSTIQEKASYMIKTNCICFKCAEVSHSIQIFLNKLSVIWFAPIKSFHHLSWIWLIAEQFLKCKIWFDAIHISAPDL